jgi:hypothetical protein
VAREMAVAFLYAQCIYCVSSSTHLGYVEITKKKGKKRGVENEKRVKVMSDHINCPIKKTKVRIGNWE